MPQEPLQILVVDDDPALRELLQRYLTEQGFGVTTVADGSQMRDFLEGNTPDLVVMDLMLPGEDGLALTRGLRANSNLPVLILSARGDEIDRIVGLEIGADDYLAKPFNPRELVARIRAILRRNQGAGSEDPPGGGKGTKAIYRFGPYELNLDNYSLRRNGEPVPLTGGEMALLEILVQNPNRILSRDRLIDLLKGYDRSPFDRSVDVRVTRLRQKIEPEPKKPRYIRTVWGKGYLFTPDPD